MPPKAKPLGKGRAPAKRKLAEEFPPGEVLTDTQKRSWKLGGPVGQGGFGLLYLGTWKLHSHAGPSAWMLQPASSLVPADENSAKPVGADARYVIKVVGRPAQLVKPSSFTWFCARGIKCSSGLGLSNVSVFFLGKLGSLVRTIRSKFCLRSLLSVCMSESPEASSEKAASSFCLCPNVREETC